MSGLGHLIPLKSRLSGRSLPISRLIRTNLLVGGPDYFRLADDTASDTGFECLASTELGAGFLSARIRDSDWRLLLRRWIPYRCKSVFVSSCLDDSRREPGHYGLRMPMISPILRLVARPELSRVKLTSRPTRLKKEVALAGKTSPFG
jgi:hypothetical protein